MKTIGEELDQSKQETFNLRVENAIHGMGVTEELRSSAMMNTLAGFMKDGLTFSDGELKYLDADGNQLEKDGTGDPYTLHDRLAEIKRSPDQQVVFHSRFLEDQKIDPAATKNLVRSTMSFEQKETFVKTYGRAEYEKLPLVAREVFR